mgnify:FL=1
MQLSVFFFKGTVAQWVEHYIIKIKEDLLQNSRNASSDIHSLPITLLKKTKL